MYFVFQPDGSYEKGFLMQSSLYNCTMTVFAYHTGKITVEGDKVVLNPKYGRMKSTDTCVSANNYEKPDELKTETMYWNTGKDEFGKDTLWLRYPDGNPSAFHHR
jgi:hypothetical protein